MPDNVPSHNPKIHRIGGFTLAELLIVVAIVGVLVRRSGDDCDGYGEGGGGLR